LPDYVDMDFAHLERVHVIRKSRDTDAPSGVLHTGTNKIRSFSICGLPIQSRRALQ